MGRPAFPPEMDDHDARFGWREELGWWWQCPYCGEQETGLPDLETTASKAIAHNDGLDAVVERLASYTDEERERDLDAFAEAERHGSDAEQFDGSQEGS